MLIRSLPLKIDSLLYIALLFCSLILLPSSVAGQFVAYNDVVYDPSNGHPALTAHVTTFNIGNGSPGPAGGMLIDKTTGTSTGVSVSFTQSGGVIWQPSSSTGGSDCSPGTEARTVFEPTEAVSLMGTVYYGSAGWWVDAVFTGLDPSCRYTFVTTANRNQPDYSARITQYTLSGAEGFSNASTTGTTISNNGASTSFSTGNNTTTGYVARWVDIAPGADGSFKVRAEAATGESKAYAFDAFMLAEVSLDHAVWFSPAQINSVAGSAGVDMTMHIPDGTNAAGDVQVTLTSDDPEVARPSGAAGDAYVMTFPMGAATQQSLVMEIGAAGNTTIRSTNDSGLKDSQLPVTVAAGEVTLDPEVLRASPGTLTPVTVRITPGSNQTRAVVVTIRSDDPAIAVPADAIDDSTVVVFAAGAVPEQTIDIQTGEQGNTVLSSSNDGGLGDVAIPVQVLRLDWIKVVVNPYLEVDWADYQQHKANMHTHTTQSDGSMHPPQVIDEYQSRGYSILAITDHNRCTFPWEYWGREPDLLGMLAIAGNELSDHHHLNSYFIDYETTSTNVDQSLAEIGAAGGIAVFNHPGRYSYTVDDYVRWYTTNDHLFGMEVINQGGRYIDLPLWDQVLSVLMPERPVWGSAADDMHSIGHLGRDWLTYLIPPSQEPLESLVSSWEDRPWMESFLSEGAPDEAVVRAATIQGQYYFSSLGTHPEAVRDVARTPVINALVLDDAAGTITLDASSDGAPLAAENYRWISMGEQIHLGPTINFRTTPAVGSYVRAELIGSGGTTFTNPIGIAWVGPTLAVSSDRISRAVHFGDSLVPDQFTVANSGPEWISYTITSDASWLETVPDEGDSSGEADPIDIHYSVAGLPVGVHQATLTVASAQATNSPHPITVTVHVGTVPPDLDNDGDVDQSDFGLFQTCLGTPATADSCAAVDFNGSGRIDGSDLEIFLRCLSGANIAAAADCIN